MLHFTDGEQRPGDGRLRVTLVDGESAVLSCASAAPLRLLVPRARGPAVWAVAASYGGGLVGGDEVALAVEVDEGASALLGTQAETKIYRSASAGCRQELRARIGPGGILVLIPDPVSCFAGARYRQVQRFELDPGASLLLLDALVSGRSARGERWAFEEYSSRNEVVAESRLVLADALRLTAGEGPPVAARLGEMELLATLVLLGPRLAAPARALRETIDALPADGTVALLVGASPLADGVHLRLASRSVEAGLAFLRRHLGFLTALLGEDPFSRRT
jgi:urease accessory protein